MKIRDTKRYQGNISCKDGLNKGQKWNGPNRSKNKGCHESILASTWPKFTFIQLLIYTNLLINSWEIGMQVKKQQLELDL